ncbi:hypothetical protein, partial [Bradyrhizobium liaoningense]|uniref:hypothetical protein n=1 Tax=Bradyrhizobium liaoningense TaxID=43992 RepID=UPI001BAB3559
MNERLARLRQRFAAAKTDADAANRDVRIESALRLAQLQRSRDPKKLIVGLKDPALTAQDREQLIHCKRRSRPTRKGLAWGLQSVDQRVCKS